MSDQFDRILAYIDEYDGDDYVSIESGNPAAEADLKRIAEALSIPLPPSYLAFLLTFGTLDIGGIEFIGVSDASYLNVVEVRDELSQDHGFPDDLIPFENEDGDSYVCVNTAGKLVRWYPLRSDRDHLDESLDDYLLRLCDELIEDETGDDE